MIKYLALFTSVSMTVLASTLLKLGSKGVAFDTGLLSILKSFAISPYIVGGFLAYTIAAFLWVYCLANFALSYVTFVSSFQYILLVLVSIFIFHEDISALKWAGSALIMLGVLFWMRG